MNRIQGMKESCKSRPRRGMNDGAPGTPWGNWGCWKSPERPTLVMLSVAKHLDSAVTCAKTRFFASLRMTQGCGFLNSPNYPVATGNPVGLLLNFAERKVEVKRNVEVLNGS